MKRFSYPLLFGLSYVGTRYFGLEKTVLAFQKVGTELRRLPVFGAIDDEKIQEDLFKSYSSLPLAIRCLDQAVVTWYLLNLHGHRAEMKIGVNITPFMSHAWVELDDKKFVDSVYIPDMEVVANYPAWQT